jgi:predicted nucleotidyltransferase
MNLSDEDREKIVSWATAHPEIRKVYLYGSRARGDNEPDSDIDLAIVLEPEPGDTGSLATWFEWDAGQDLRLSYPVHLQWYERGSQDRPGQGVKKNGVLLFCRD